MYKSRSMKKIYVKTVAADGNCRIFPLVFQRRSIHVILFSINLEDYTDTELTAVTTALPVAS